MKRVVSSSLISVVVLLLVAGGFFYYQYYKGSNAGALDTIPADAAWVVSCDPSSGELQRLARSGFFKGNDSVLLQLILLSVKSFFQRVLYS
jgi:hypothetical protein